MSEFDKMTVLELRKVAKDMNVKLGAGISKQGIVDKLNAVAALAKPAAEDVQEAAQPVRHASIITDDEFEENDVPSSGYTPRPVRPVTPRPAPANGGASSLSSISAKAPAFTMEGSRAWHNPRAYNNNYQRPAPNNTWNQPRSTVPQDPRSTVGAPVRTPNAPQQPARPSYQRFGPEKDTPAYTRPDYTQPQQPRSDFGTYRADYAAPQQPQQPASQREMSPNEILMTGECGDCEGILEVLPDGFGFLRTGSLLAGKNDVYVGNVQVKRYGLRTGDHLAGKTHPQRDMDKNNALLYITEVNGQEPEEKTARPLFDELTAIYPKRKLNLSARYKEDVFLRTMDLMCPVALGQRALVSVQNGVNINDVLVKLSVAVSAAAPKAKVMTLLVDERPEEVTEMKERLRGEAYAATFDLSAEMTVKTAEMVLEMAMRQAEQKKDVILLVNSLTRLCKACNIAAPQTARLLPNGLVAGGLTRARKFFAAARNLREGGSLTIIALQEVNGKNPLDDLMAAEMENTCNMHAKLLPGMGRMQPAVDVAACQNKRLDLLLTPDEIKAADIVRLSLNGKPVDECCRMLEDMVAASSDHDTLVQQILMMQ